MKKYLLFFLIGIQSFNFTFGQNNSLLYQISKEGYKNIYIYGTIHVAKKELFEVNNSLLKIIKKIDSAYFEIIPNETEMVKAIEPFIHISDSLAIKNYLTLNQKKTISNFLKTHFGNDAYLNFHPLILNLSIHQTLYTKDDILAMDAYFLEMLKNRKKGIGQLETIQEQLNYLNQQSVNHQINEILNGIEQFEKHKQDIQTLFEIYKTQNLDSIYNFTINEMNTTDNKDFYLETMLKSRNNKMVYKIENLAKNSCNIYFIGAAHLPGEFGLLNTLKQKGFQIIPLK